MRLSQPQSETSDAPRSGERDQHPRKGSNSRDGRQRLGDEERRNLRKDIGDAARDVPERRKNKNKASKRNNDS